MRAIKENYQACSSRWSWQILLMLYSTMKAKCLPLLTFS